MNFEIDLTTHVPIYTQLTDQIRRAIASGELKPGDQLPTVRQLAADLRVNFNTVARAYRMLDEDGIISTQHGRGTFILGPVSRQDAERMRREGLARLARIFAAQAHKLGFDPAEARAALEETLNAWQTAGAPPAGD